MSDKRHQLSILDQWATQSGQVSRSTQRLAEIDEWITWELLYGMAAASAKTKLRNKARFVMAALCWNIERSISWAKSRSPLLPAAAP